MELEKLIVNVKNIASCQTSKLVIVDTTAAPALYVFGQQYSWSLCRSLNYIPIHSEDFLTYSIQ